MKKRENKSPSRSAKRALTSSVLALVLCFVMLLGTTFAWFTDTASTKVNTIQAGNLDVALEVKTTTKTDDGEEEEKWVSAEGETLNFITADGRTENILWEPGCSYYTDDLRIVNKGNLAIKFKMEITGLGGDAELNEVIDWLLLNSRDNENYDPEGYLSSPYTWSWKNTSGEESYAPLDDEFYLLPGECVYMQLIAEMKSDAGNEYQGKSIKDIAIAVVATQYTYEYDSTGNQYDKDAEYPIYVANGLDTSSDSDYKQEIKDNPYINDEIENGFVVADKNLVTDGTLLTFADTYDTVLLSGSEIKCDTLAVFNAANTLVLADCDITLAEGGKLVVNNTGSYQQVCFKNVTINGTLVTNDNVNNIVSNYCTGNITALVY